MYNKTKMELLAPAGDQKSFLAAVYNGADAVYLGLQNFNARMKADNFTTENIAATVKFAHLYSVKVYVTINILVDDTEVDAFIRTVRACVQAHVDAYIVQDLGMAQLLRRHFPNIVLHASTQMGIHNLDGAQVLEKLGFKRVVLARETKLADIQLIHQNTNLEIEYFAQGALCVAFSGNCYLSSLKNGNSGNRGKCLQLCRLPYKVFAGEKLISEGYNLSAKDLCLLERLGELKNAGVDCLKIEGRLKRASYVAQVVRSYRLALDRAGGDLTSEKRKIRALFSRGAFNESAYLYDNFQIINPQIGHHEGRKIGRVLAVERFKNIFKITLQIKEALGQGDAIRLVLGEQQFSIGVGNVNVVGEDTVDIFSKQHVPAGCDVYLLKSAAQEKVLSDFTRALPIDFYFTARVGQLPELVANYGTVSVKVQGQKILDAAKTAPATKEQVAKQLGKLNETHFALQHLECNLDAVFIPVAELNELRRTAVEALENAIVQNFEAHLPNILETGTVVAPVLKLPRANFYLVSAASDLTQVNFNGYGVMICPSVYSVEAVRTLVNELLARGVSREALYLNLPIVATQSEMELLNQILREEKLGLVANNYAHLKWAREYPTIAGVGLNVYNQFTADELIKLGCQNVIWSLEKNPAGNGGSALASGYPALMTLCHCPVQNAFGSNCANCRYRDDLVYQDEKGNRYRLRRVKLQHCYFALYSEERYEKAVKTGKIYDLRELTWKSTK